MKSKEFAHLCGVCKQEVSPSGQKEIRKFSELRKYAIIVYGGAHEDCLWALKNGDRRYRKTRFLSIYSPN